MISKEELIQSKEAKVKFRLLSLKSQMMNDAAKIILQGHRTE